MVSTRPTTSKSSSPFSNPLVTVPNAPITIGIIVTCMFQVFQFPSKIEVLILLFTFFPFYSVVSRDSEVDLRVFHISVSWWSFTRFWVTGCILKSSRRFSVFWSISIILVVMSKSSSPYTNPVLRALITISKIITFMLHNFFNSLARSRYLSLFSFSFNSFLWSSGIAKSTIQLVISFCCLL